MEKRLPQCLLRAAALHRSLPPSNLSATTRSINLGGTSQWKQGHGDHDPDQERNGLAGLKQARTYVGHRSGVTGFSTMALRLGSDAREEDDWVSCGIGGDARTLCEDGRVHERLSQGEIQAYGEILQECIDKKDLAEGKRVHAQLIESGAKSTVYLHNTVLKMYTICGSLTDAHQLFDQMPERDACTWSTLILGYFKHGRSEEALKLFHHMEEEGVKPTRPIFITILRVCRDLGALEQGKRIHTRIPKILLDSDVVIGNILIDMYAKCGNMEHALQVIAKMPERNVISWTLMISGYGRHGKGDEALKCFWKMQQEGVNPNEITIVSTLKACAILGALEHGQQVHEYLVKIGAEISVQVGNCLVYMYAECGSIEHAWKVFDKMPERNVVSWNIIITAFHQLGHREKALKCFWQMQQEGLKPDKITFNKALWVCASLGALEQGQQIHAQLVENGFEADVIVGSILVHMYAKCRRLACAWQVFKKITKRDVVAWTAMIIGFSYHGQHMRSLNCYWQMQQEGVEPSAATFAAILYSCARIRALEEGKQIHASLIEKGFESDVLIGDRLILMYKRCGRIDYARQVFDNMPERNVVVWHTMISGYTNMNDEEVFKLFRQMTLDGVKANASIFVTVLNACAALGALEEGKQIHAHVIKRGFTLDVHLRDALIKMYTKCGSKELARQVSDKCLKQDTVS